MAREEPIQTYYPSARVRFIVRFEDFGREDVPKPPEKPPQLRRGVGAVKATTPALNVVDREGALVLVAPGDDPSHLGSPQQQVSSQDGLTHVIDGIIPTRAQLRRNGIRTASTMSIAVPFLDFPFDPRALRSVGVQYFLGCVAAADYQRGIRGEVRSDATPAGGLPFHVVPDQYTDSSGRLRTNLRFEGWIDNLDDEWPEEDAPEVTFECTDNTRLLIDQEAPPRLTVDPKIRIDRAVADYLSNFPQFRGLAVQYLPRVDASLIPKLETALGKASFPPKLGPPPAGGGGGGKLMVWDYLTDVVGAVGHNLRMEGTAIIIQRPRTLYDARFPGRADDPFVGRQLASGRTLQRRLFVYGHNVSEMKAGRKFAKYTPRNVEIRSYDPTKKRTIVVRYPQKADRQAKQIPGDASEQQWWVIPRPGLRDEATARVIAQGVYESQSRNELSYRIVTKALGSFGGGNLDPDALDVLPGDAIDVEVSRIQAGGGPGGGAAPSTVAMVRAATENRASEFLQQLGFSATLASAYQRAISTVGLPTTFRTKTVGIDWDAESNGVVLDFELVNYIEVRADVDLPEDEQITPAQVQDAAAAGGGPDPIVIQDDVGV